MLNRITSVKLQYLKHLSMYKQVSSALLKIVAYKLFIYRSSTLSVKSIWKPSKIFISHPKRVIFNETN